MSVDVSLLMGILMWLPEAGQTSSLQQTGPSWAGRLQLFRVCGQEFRFFSNILFQPSFDLRFPTIQLTCQVDPTGRLVRFLKLCLPRGCRGQGTGQSGLSGPGLAMRREPYLHSSGFACLALIPRQAQLSSSGAGLQPANLSRCVRQAI